MGEIGDVQSPVTEYAKSLGWLARRMQYIGTNGCPDTWFFKDGVVIICEWKKRGKEATLQQRRQHKKLLVAGFKVHVIDNYEDGCALFD